MAVDVAKVRRENIRWQILLTLNNARPVGAFEEVILSVIQAMYQDATDHEIRRELDYLAERQLVETKVGPDGRWFANLTWYGIDIAEYTVDCQPGIARPPKYWGKSHAG